MLEEGSDTAKWLPHPLQSGLWINVICNHSKRKNKTLVKKGHCFQTPTTVQSSNYIHVCLQPNLLGQFPFIRYHLIRFANQGANTDADQSNLPWGSWRGVFAQVTSGIKSAGGFHMRKGMAFFSWGWKWDLWSYSRT